jgi:hypothetical protein
LTVKTLTGIMTTDVYPRENCIAPAIVFIIWTRVSKRRFRLCVSSQETAGPNEGSGISKPKVLSLTSIGAEYLPRPSCVPPHPLVPDTPPARCSLAAPCTPAPRRLGRWLRRPAGGGAVALCCLARGVGRRRARGEGSEFRLFLALKATPRGATIVLASWVRSTPPESRSRRGGVGSGEGGRGVGSRSRMGGGRPNWGYSEPMTYGTEYRK